MKQVSQKRLCGPPRTTGLKLFLKYSNFAICFLNNRPQRRVGLLFPPSPNKHKNKNLHETCEIYCPRLAGYVALKCDKSCKLQVKGLFCKEHGPTLKLGIPVSVGRRLVPAGSGMRAPGMPSSLVYLPQRSICFPGAASLPWAMSIIRVQCMWQKFSAALLGKPNTARWAI